MAIKGYRILLGAVLALGAPSAWSQLEVGGDLLDNCGEVDALQQAGNFTEARDKARLCLEGIEQELTGEVGQYFLTEIAGWTRTSFEQNQTMGISNINASYQKGDVSVDVTLTGQAGGGTGGSGLGGLGGIFGGIASSAILQGGQQVTVAGLPASVTPDGTLNVPLEDGSILTFMSYEFDTADAALAGYGDLVNEFPVADINAALQ